MDLHHDIVMGGLGVGQVLKGETTDAGLAISNGDCLHDCTFLLGTREIGTPMPSKSYMDRPRSPARQHY